MELKSQTFFQFRESCFVLKITYGREKPCLYILNWNKANFGFTSFSSNGFTIATLVNRPDVSLFFDISVHYLSRPKECLSRFVYKERPAVCPVLCWKSLTPFISVKFSGHNVSILVISSPPRLGLIYYAWKIGTLNGQ